MLNYLRKIFWSCFTIIDSKLKFPNLNKGEIGIQLGFDMYAPTTSDLFTMYKRVKPKGKVYGIDPDPFNLEIAEKIIEDEQLNIHLIQKGAFSKKDEVEFLLGEKSSWNQLNVVPIDSTVKFSGKKIKVEINKLDEIVANLNIDIQKIQHINLTINGAEYNALLGAKKLLKEINNLTITIVAGRHDESGTINGKKDYELIIPLLQMYGFKTKFRRINQLFWWGFITKFIMNRKWIYNQSNFGVIMASKGNHKIKWYQSFS